MGCGVAYLSHRVIGGYVSGFIIPLQGCMLIGTVGYKNRFDWYLSVCKQRIPHFPDQLCRYIFPIFTSVTRIGVHLKGFVMLHRFDHMVDRILRTNVYRARIKITCHIFFSFNWKVSWLLKKGLIFSLTSSIIIFLKIEIKLYMYDIVHWLLPFIYGMYNIYSHFMLIIWGMIANYLKLSFPAFTVDESALPSPPPPSQLS